MGEPVERPWDLGMLSESDANPGLSPSSGVIVPFLHRPGVAPELQQEQRPPRCGVGDSRSCSAGDHQHPCLSCLLDSSGAVAGQGSHSLPDSTGEVQEYRFLSRIDVWQKPSQYCNYPPIKMNILILKDKKMYNHLENLPAASCLC